MKKLILLLLVTVTSVGLASETYSLLPRKRQPRSVPDNLINPFAGQANTIIEQEVDPNQQEPMGLKDLRDFLQRNPVIAVSWHHDPSMRSILLGYDIVLRINSSVPADYLEVGPSFVLTDIQIDTVTFLPAGRIDYPIVVPVKLRTDVKSRPSDIKIKREKP